MQGKPVTTANFPTEDFVQAVNVLQPGQDTFSMEAEGPSVSTADQSKVAEPVSASACKSSLSEGPNEVIEGGKAAPFMLEIFCGSAGVCAQFRLMGGKVLGVDHHLNRCKLKAAAVKLDVTQQWVQELIEKEIRMGRVAAVHMGPPCGTASRARNIPIRKKLRRAGAPNPKPLRSSKWPEGLPGLKGVNLAKVTNANILYQFTAQLAELCDSYGVLFTMRTPRTL